MPDLGRGAYLDPLIDAAARERRDASERLRNLESRPQVVPPVAIVSTPYLLNPSADWYVPYTGAAFGAGGWSGIMPRVAHPGVYCRFNWRTGAGTTGEVRLLSNAGFAPGGSTAIVALAAASSGTITFLWLHGLPLWITSYNLDLEARRTGGANSVEIQAPLLYLIDPSGCTATGL